MMEGSQGHGLPVPPLPITPLFTPQGRPGSFWHKSPHGLAEGGGPGLPGGAGGGPRLRVPRDSPHLGRKGSKDQQSPQTG